jgi:hypothetical protein
MRARSWAREGIQPFVCSRRLILQNEGDGRRLRLLICVMLGVKPLFGFISAQRDLLLTGQDNNPTGPYRFFNQFEEG